MSFATPFLDSLATVFVIANDKDGNKVRTQLMPESYINWRRERQAKRIAEEAAIREREEAEAKQQADYKARYQKAIRNENEIMERYEELEMMTPMGGVIARIERAYDNYTSRWEYVMREDGSLVRTRGQDNATVHFESLSQLINDVENYLYHDFSLATYAPSASSSD